MLLALPLILSSTPPNQLSYEWYHVVLVAVAWHDFIMKDFAFSCGISWYFLKPSSVIVVPRCAGVSSELQIWGRVRLSGPFTLTYFWLWLLMDRNCVYWSSWRAEAGGSERMESMEAVESSEDDKDTADVGPISISTTDRTALCVTDVTLLLQCRCGLNTAQCVVYPLKTEQQHNWLSPGNDTFHSELEHTSRPVLCTVGL